MTESQWRRCADPAPMLAFLSGLASGRKLRLFAVACCRRVDHVFPDDRIRRALDAAERLADGAITTAEWADAEAGVKAARAVPNPATDARRWNAVTAAVIAVSHASRPEDEVRLAAYTASAASRAAEGEAAAQAGLVREVFQYPLRPAAFSSEWRTSTAVALAGMMYESRDFSMMPILADALQDAGCNDRAILSHCRDAEKRHARGCWVADLVLGRE